MSAYEFPEPMNNLPHMAVGKVAEGVEVANQLNKIGRLGWTMQVGPL